ncbi:MAG: hypothetical protein IT430_02020 [Phycisphaerales bacterium]|nr:hypothetical protein [Phycisphaerales bacterium]
MNIMLRWARRIAIFLLLGAIVNVAVAWGIVVHYIPMGRNLEPIYRNPYDERFVTFVSTRFAYEVVENSALDSATADQSAFFTKPFRNHVWWPATHDGKRNAYQCRAGWPMMAVTAWQTADLVWDQRWIFQREGVTELHWGLEWKSAPPTGIEPVVLPFCPIWPEFLFNSVAYATPFAVLFLAIGATRRFIRRFRNQCSTCGYPRGTSPVCTECGEPLPGVAAK